MRRAKSFNCLPIFIDCQNPEVHAKKYQSLLSYVINEIRHAIGHTKKLPLLVGEDDAVSREFVSQLKSVISQSKSSILIIFDEIENISPDTAASEHWKNGRDSLLFWQNIRSFIQRECEGKVAICLVGTSPSLLERSAIHNVANPMYLFTKKRFMPAFTFEDTQEMINRLGFFMGLEMDAAQISDIYKKYGGHPFFIRQVCSNINSIVSNARPCKVSSRNIDDANNKFGAQLESYLSDILNSLKNYYPEEFNLLCSIVRYNNTEVSEYGKFAPELIDHLIGYGLVEVRNEDTEIRFGAIRNALEKIIGFKSQDQMWSDCMLRRNKIETDIRREIYVNSRQFKTDAEWSSFLERTLTKSRFENLSSIEPKKIFSKSDCQLYWSDLISFVKSDVIFIHLDSRKREILQAMHIVNSIGRKDSHAKEFIDEEFNDLDKALLLLEDEFQMPV